ncbi:hypothetical protein MHYP_G00069070 [Metynnis hypsauchen]
MEELTQITLYNLAMNDAELEEAHAGQSEWSESALKVKREHLENVFKAERKHLESALKEEREQNAAMWSYLKDLEHENFLLKSTFLSLKMGVMNEKDKRRAEKKEMIREMELLEGMAMQRKVWEIIPLSAQQLALASLCPEKIPGGEVAPPGGSALLAFGLRLIRRA